MSRILIHLSDVHFRKDNSEGHGVVFKALFEDIERQMKDYPVNDVFVVISGDIAQAGQSSEQYEEFLELFNDNFRRLGISKDHVICVPGNHDLARDFLKANLVQHEGVISQLLSESAFNNFINEKPNVLTDKFKHYLEFESKFCEIGVGSSVVGQGWDLGGEVGIYCLNTALCSAGGLDSSGATIVDKGRLAVDTRGLHSWIQNSSHKTKILVMHHPLNWLCDWAQNEVRMLLRKDFKLCMSGHTHDQDSYHSIGSNKYLVECSAPPLYTRKTDQLGYSLISILSNGDVEKINYRQWTKQQSFVSGTAFSNTDDGVVTITLDNKTDAAPIHSTSQHTEVDRILTKKLNDALISFSSQPLIWIEPIISANAEVSRTAEQSPKVEISEILDSSESFIINAPPLFGLTCLAHYLVRQAWRNQSVNWVLLDASELKPNKASIEEAVNFYLQEIGAHISNVACIVLDALKSGNKDSQKLVQKVCELFPNIRVICMKTNDAIEITVHFSGDVKRDFKSLHLWSMTRSRVRQVVAEYNESKLIGDEDTVTQKMVSDLEVMNIHRTPLNCLTLLKVSEIDFDESPVNRTEMIKRVLFLLFNVDDIPTYKTRPDLKDCEYVLGYFCETILRKGDEVFSRDQFLLALERCCRDTLIDLEVSVVFDVLYKNNIIVKRGSFFSFRFSYWIYYFAAQRMHHDETFAEFIFEDMRYSLYPELIEFYTGIDRRREDALKTLIKDIKKNCDNMQKSISLPEELDVFGSAQWNPTPENIAQMQADIKESVQTSNLPASIKDQYADRGYNPTRPYNQEIQHVLSGEGFHCMLQTMRAGARALRNSDYVAPDVKRQLLREILRSWEQAAMVLLVILPVLAEKGSAQFQGVGFILSRDFEGSLKERFYAVLAAIPYNVVSFYEEDLFSQKMGPLLLDHVDVEESGLRKHFLISLLLQRRPRGWRSKVQNYISTISKNSFYLADVFQRLRSQYRYSYASPQTLKEIEFLIHMSITKHLTGAKDPGIRIINQLKGKIDGEAVIPPREVD